MSRPPTMKLQPPVCDQTAAFAAIVKERGPQNAAARKDPDKGDPAAKKRRAAVASWNNEAYRIVRAESDQACPNLPETAYCVALRVPQQHPAAIPGHVIEGPPHG